MLERKPFERAIEQLWREGVCMVPNAVDPEILGDCLEALNRGHRRLFDPSKEEDKLFVSRGRFYAALEIRDPFSRRQALLPKGVEEVLGESLGRGFVCDSWGIINALPGAEEQGWHRDGGILFPSHPLEFMLPAAAITVAIPLVEMNEETGTTGFCLRSHRASGHGDTPDYEPVVPVGAALMWDYRIYHKGMKNRSERPRPLLYATYCRDWWSDTGNHEDQDRLLLSGSAFEGFDPDLKARFARAKITD